MATVNTATYYHSPGESLAGLAVAFGSWAAGERVWDWAMVKMGEWGGEEEGKAYR